MLYVFIILNMFVSLKQIETKNLEITGIEAEYILSDSIFCNIGNSSEGVIQYYLGMEYYEEEYNEWGEFVNDVANPKSRMSIIKSLNPKEQKKEIINLKNTIYFFSLSTDVNPEKTKYRLKINYRISNQDYFKQIYSKPFTVKRE